MTELGTCRQIMSLMIIMGFMIHHMLRVNLSIAIVEMIQSNTSHSSETEERFDWSEIQKNEIFGVFYWGYLVTQIPGGRLAEIYGSKVVVAVSLFSASFLTIITPFACYYSYYAILVVRFSLGVALGLQWPAIPPMAKKWIAPTDTSKFMSHMKACSLGVAVTFPIAGYLIVLWGWPSVFYFTGVVAFIWTLAWVFLIYDTPNQHPRISESEKRHLRHILKNRNEEKRSTRAPWRKILTSAPVWAFVVAHSCTSVTINFSLLYIPTYLNAVLNYNIKENGWLSSLPQISRYACAVFTAWIGDKIIKTQRFQIVNVRKLFGAASLGISSLLFTMQIFYGHYRIATLMVFVFSFAATSLETAGPFPNCVDISPSYSGTIFGLSQILICIGAYGLTKIVGIITDKGKDFSQWSYVFLILIIFNLVAFVVFLVFASGDVQSWDLKNVAEDIEQKALSKKCETKAFVNTETCQNK